MFFILNLLKIKTLIFETHSHILYNGYSLFKNNLITNPDFAETWRKSMYMREL